MGLSVVSVDAGQMVSEQFKKVEAIKLGNSYGVKQGDMVVAIRRAGRQLSIPVIMEIYLPIVVRNVHTVDGSSRCSIPVPAETRRQEHFSLNTSGEAYRIGSRTKYDEDGCAGSQW